MNIGLSRDIKFIPEMEAIESIPFFRNLYFEIVVSQKYLEDISISEIIDLCEFTSDVNIIGLRLSSNILYDLDLVEKSLYILDELKAKFLVVPFFTNSKYQVKDMDKIFELTANYNKTICIETLSPQFFLSMKYITEMIDRYTKSVFGIAYNMYYNRMNKNMFNEIGENIEYIKILYFMNFYKENKLNILDNMGEINIFRLIRYLHRYKFRYFLILDYPDITIYNLINDIEKIMEFLFSIREK